MAKKLYFKQLKKHILNNISNDDIKYILLKNIKEKEKITLSWFIFDKYNIDIENKKYIDHYNDKIANNVQSYEYYLSN